MGKRNPIKLGWEKIKLVDKFLIIIMVILLMYAVSILFIGKANNEAAENIDIVVRTTIASIFGD